MEVKLTLSEKRPDYGDAIDTVKDLDGAHIVTSSYCPKHKLGLIVTAPEDEPFDVECALHALASMIRLLGEWHIAMLRERARHN